MGLLDVTRDMSPLTPLDEEPEAMLTSPLLTVPAPERISIAPPFEVKLSPAEIETPAPLPLSLTPALSKILPAVVTPSPVLIINDPEFSTSALLDKNFIVPLVLSFDVANSSSPEYPEVLDPLLNRSEPPDDELDARLSPELINTSPPLLDSDAPERMETTPPSAFDA